jgi:hypothetical protein
VKTEIQILGLFRYLSNLLGGVMACYKGSYSIAGAGFLRVQYRIMTSSPGSLSLVSLNILFDLVSRHFSNGDLG